MSEPLADTAAAAAAAATSITGVPTPSIYDADLVLEVPGVRVFALTDDGGQSPAGRQLVAQGTLQATVVDGDLVLLVQPGAAEEKLRKAALAAREKAKATAEKKAKKAAKKKKKSAAEAAPTKQEKLPVVPPTAMWCIAVLRHLPALRVKIYHYVFPTDDLCYGVVFPSSAGKHIPVWEKTLKEHSTFDVHELDAARLKEIASGKLHPADVRPDRLATMGEKLAVAIGSGSVLLAKGIDKSSGLLSRGIHGGGRWAKKKLKPRAEPVKVSDKTKLRVAKARATTGTMVQVSSIMVAGAMASVSELSYTIGDMVGETKVGEGIKDVREHVKAKVGVDTAAGKGEQTLAVESTASSGGDAADAMVEAAEAKRAAGSKGARRVSKRKAAAMSVAQQTVGAAMVIYDALEKAGAALVGDVTDTSVMLVEHKYGEEAGETAATAGHIVKDTVQAQRQMKSLGVKALAKRTAKAAAKDVVLGREEGVQTNAVGTGALSALHEASDIVSQAKKAGGTVAVSTLEVD